MKASVYQFKIIGPTWRTIVPNAETKNAKPMTSKPSEQAKNNNSKFEWLYLLII